MTSLTTPLITPTYNGNSAYCYSHSLRMCLDHAGMTHLPEVGLLECMTGMPFGATFLKLDTPLFFPSPATTDPDTSLTQALDTLGWTCEVRRSETAGEAEAALRKAVREGSVLLGPLDMGFLSYDPQHQRKQGGDHFVVVLGVEGDRVQLHDPQLYPFAVLPMRDLMQTWHAAHLGYATASYTLRHGFYERSHVSYQERLEATLAVAKDLMTHAPDGPVAYGGEHAFVLAADTLRHSPTPAYTSMFAGFALPLGARRCLDGAALMREVKQADAARHLTEKANVFGRAQYAAATGDWQETADLLEVLAGLEGALVQSLA